MDDSHLTIEFDEHFVIKPSITFFSCENDFITNSLGERGKLVEQGAEYNSGTNPKFLSVDEIKDFNRRA
jgi:UDP-N-acetylglucosamine 4,6-dehydratase